MSLVFKSITLESILDPANMMLALKRVESNHGAPGVDGMRTDELRVHIFGHPGELSKAIKDGTYRPSPVKRVTIPKPEKGKYRELGIPTVIDRLIQQAVAQVLSLHFETVFSVYSCALPRAEGRTRRDPDDNLAYGCGLPMGGRPGFGEVLRYGRSQPTDKEAVSIYRRLPSDIAHSSHAQVRHLYAERNHSVNCRAHARRTAVAAPCEHLLG